MGEKYLPYYKLDRTQECKLFFHANNEGYFNFWDKFLIMKTKSCSDTYLVLVNRTDKKFPGKMSDIPTEEMLREYGRSVIHNEPKQMFIDFPELNCRK